MAGVRKTSGSSAPRGAVYDFAKARANAATIERTGPGDTAGITSEARELSSALRAVEESEEVRAAKVASLRAQIASGTYNPDPREIARRMVERGFE